MNQAGCNPRVVVEIRQVINMVKIAHLVPGEMVTMNDDDDDDD